MALSAFAQRRGTLPALAYGNSIVAATSITPTGVYVAQNGVYSSVDYSRSVNVLARDSRFQPQHTEFVWVSWSVLCGSMEDEAHLDEFADMRIVLAGGWKQIPNCEKGVSERIRPTSGICAHLSVQMNDRPRNDMRWNEKISIQAHKSMILRLLESA